MSNRILTASLATATSLVAWGAPQNDKPDAPAPDPKSALMEKNAMELIQKAANSTPASVLVSDIGNTDINQTRSYVYSRGAAAPPPQDKQCTVVYQSEAKAYKDKVVLLEQFRPSRNGRVIKADRDEVGVTKTNETFILKGPIADGTYVFLRANRDQDKIEYDEGALKAGLAIKKRYVNNPETVTGFYDVAKKELEKCKDVVQEKKGRTGHDLDDDQPPASKK